MATYLFELFFLSNVTYTHKESQLDGPHRKLHIQSFAFVQQRISKPPGIKIDAMGDMNVNDGHVYVHFPLVQTCR